MSRYTGPSWKQPRRLGLSLTGTGKELARRNYVPGQHGPNNRSKLSEIYCGTFCFLTGYLMPPLADGRHIVLVNLVPPTDELKIDN